MRTMSKLGFILCIVIFASTANGTYRSSALESVQKGVDDLLEGSMKEVRSKLQAAKENASEKSERLITAALDYSQKMFDQVATVVLEAQKEAENMTRNADDVDVTKCTESTEELNLMALATVSNISSCVVDKLESAAGYSESMIKISNDVLLELDELRAKVRNCADNVDNLLSAGKALVCTNSVSAKALSSATNVVSLVSNNLAKLGSSLASVEPSLVDCSVSGGLVDFYRLLSNLKNETTKCIQHKINDAHSTEPNGHRNTTYGHDEIMEVDGSTTKAHEFTSTSAEAFETNTQTTEINLTIEEDSFNHSRRL